MACVHRALFIFQKYVLLTLREEHRLKLFEDRMLRRIFRLKRDEMVGGWRKFHDEELHSLYTSSNIIGMIKSGRMRWTGHVARMGVKRSAYRILVGKPIGKRPLGNLDIGGRIILRPILEKWDGMDWINPVQNRNQWRAFVNTVLNLRII
jgi:hypothetical protein